VFKLHRRVAQTGQPARVDEMVWQGKWPTGPQADHAYAGSVMPLGPNIIITGRDVPETRRNERKLRLQAELLDLAHDAVVVREPARSRGTFWNREAEAIYGYSCQEALGQITHELLATVFPESREAVDEALAQEGQWAGELRHTRKDGTVIVVSSRQAAKPPSRPARR
jgi:PAS domain S-box-containing protein